MNLEDLRSKIDQIDTKLVELLNQRAQVVIEIGKAKGDGPVYAPDREKKVLERIAAMNKGPLPDKTLVAVWRELMSGSFFLERSLRIAFLGPQGSYTHTAAMRKFGQSVDYEAVTDIQGIFDEVTRGHCDLGVVPVENSAGGQVGETLDAFADTNAMICAEVYMPIHHNLLANCTLKEVQKVYSKPEVFLQCKKWLSTTFNEANTIAAASSAKAAQMASQEQFAAAIGSDIAAELYGLKIICENIEDIGNNVTRFLIISKEDARPTGEDKTSILFSTAHKAGALADVLNVFKNREVNLTNIESRPSKKRQREYYFFVDCQGHRKDEKLIECLSEIKQHCLQLSVLGSYPKSDLILE
ncbi:MAG: chorismate mutase [Planctomycetes bacterium GWF2_42_9]|nr:MAG: chorismate mutase [Planctomycetes bacterium GWF2_42_9]